MEDLGLPAGDSVSLAPCCHSLNNRGQVVGFSFPGPQGSGRAILWQNRVPIDLNTLIATDSPWYLLNALSINEGGQIVGYGTKRGEVHAFLATPCDQTDANCCDNSGNDDKSNDRVTPEKGPELPQVPSRFGRLGTQFAKPQ